MEADDNMTTALIMDPPIIMVSTLEEGEDGQVTAYPTNEQTSSMYIGQGESPVKPFTTEDENQDDQVKGKGTPDSENFEASKEANNEGVEENKAAKDFLGMLSKTMKPRSPA